MYINVDWKEYFVKTFPCLVPRILLLQTLFFQKLLISSFCSTQHCRWCDTPLESSWGGDFKYIYFYGFKICHFPDKESSHICHFPWNILELTFVWKFLKNFHWIYNFLYTQSDSFFGVGQKKNICGKFSTFPSQVITRSDVFFGKNIHQ